MKTHPDDSAFAAGACNGFTHGLSKRELLAAMAMQGTLSADTRRVGSPCEVAHHAVKMADALISVLNVEGEKND